MGCCDRQTIPVKTAFAFYSEGCFYTKFILGGVTMSKQATIQLETVSRSGSRKVRTGKHSATVKEFLALMEEAVYSGRYRYVAVLVNGEVYKSFEG